MNTIVTNPANKITTQNSASTNGWDTVYAIQYPSVNQAIVTQKSSPKDFSNSTNDPDLGEMELTGNFGDWQICMSGDGKNLRMNVPVTTSNLKFMNKDHKFDKTVNATIEVNLLWVSAPDKSETDKDSEKKSNLNVSNDKDTVFVLNIDPGENKMDDMKESFYRTLLGVWLKDNVEAFKHTFAGIELNKQNAKSRFQWLMPTDTLYAVVDVEDSMEKSIFGVLCMTENRKSPGVHQISPYAISADCTSGLLIAPERIIENMILPGVQLMFMGATAEDFEITNDGLSITNTKDLVCQDQQLENEKWITPKVDKGNFILTLNTTYFELEFSDLYFDFPIPTGISLPGGWSPDMPGITVHMMYHSQSSLTITEDNTFKMDIQKVNSSLNVHTATWLTVTEIITGLVLSIGGAVAGGIIGASFKAGTQAATSATEAAVTGMEVVATESAVAVTTNIAPTVIAEAGVEAAAILADAGAQGGKFATFFARNGAKILGSMIGAGLGMGVASIPQIIKALANSEGSDKQNLDQFGTEALAILTWPDQGPVELEKGELTGSFRMGFVPKKTS